MKFRNQFKTVALLASLTALFLWIGQALGGQSGMVVGLLFAGLVNFGAYWWSDKLILRMYGARELRESKAPNVYRIIRELARQNGIPTPKVYLIPEPTPNAFATGRNPQHAAVAVTGGLLELLDAEELEGVLAHEMGHIKNRDTLISTVAATMAGALSMLANMTMWGSLTGGRSRDDHAHPLAGLLGILLAPLDGAMIQAAISRSREYLADESGAETTANPLALASALIKIEKWSKKVPLTTGTPATAHLFIINPFRGEHLLSLFSTHPPTSERIKRLEAMAASRPTR